jgi:hypothetical protein
MSSEPDQPSDPTRLGSGPPTVERRQVGGSLSAGPTGSGGFGVGTRGFVGFVVDNMEKIFINHKDSYPTGRGEDLLSWLIHNQHGLLRPTPGGVPDQIRALRVASDPTGLSPADAERLRNALRHGDDQAFLDGASAQELLDFASYYDLDVLVQLGLVSGLSQADVERIRDLLRRHEQYADDAAYIDDACLEELLEFVTYDLDTLLRAGVTWDGSGFATDSLYCEWGYLIDLDTSTFEVYRGFQRVPHAAGRFADRPPARDEYHPVALLASWPLADLPSWSDFEDACSVGTNRT